MNISRYESAKWDVSDLPFYARPKRPKLVTVFGWFAILGLVAVVIGAALGFAI